MSYRLHNITSFEPVGSTVYHYGYKCEVKANGEVWADIPAELYGLELSAGRVREPVTIHNIAPKKPAPVVKPVEETLEELQAPTAKVVAVDEDIKPVPQPAVVEDTVKVEEVAVKIDGRTKAAKQSKHK